MTTSIDPPDDIEPPDNTDDEIIGHLRANAELVIDAVTSIVDFPFGLDARSVEWLDGYINRLRSRAPAGGRSKEEDDQLVSNLGSYLGEAIIAAFGGAWARDEHGWYVRFDDLNHAYPFTKVSKQLRNGPEDSIYGFYSIMPSISASDLAHGGVCSSPLQ